MKNIFRICLLLCIFFTASSALLADRVFLKNGTTYEGRIVSQTRDEIRIQTPAGMRNIAKTQVARVQYGGPTLEEIQRQQAAEAEQKRQAEAARQQEEEERRRAEAEAARRQSERDRAAATQNEDVDTSDSTSDSAPGPRVAFWLSVAFPGAGYLYRGDTIMGAAFATGGVIALGYAVDSYQEYEAGLAAENDAQFIGNLTLADSSSFLAGNVISYDLKNTARGQVNTASNRFTYASAVYVILWGFGILDTLLDIADPAPGGVAFDFGPHVGASHLTGMHRLAYNPVADNAFSSDYRENAAFHPLAFALRISF
ncbi:MAG: hypothetical protein KDK27_18570 [Leptospiraceae bacterium]|nr:hypothetical protein [Leptospiraceae bacterium]